MRTRQLTFDNTQMLFLAGGVLLLCLSGFAFLYWSENAALLQYVYPAAAVTVGALLYVARPSLYLGFVLWMWFVTPFVRRLIDYQSGFSFISVVMLAPFLVTAISAFTLLRYGGLLQQPRYRPIGLVLLGLLYGYLVGVARVGVYGATYDALLWFTPVLLGFHVLVHWKEYPLCRQVVRSTFTWGVLLLGSYGILQFIVLPAWDAHWMIGANMASIGKPVPFGLRIFGTLNAPGPFAVTMVVGLLLLFDGRGLLPRFAAVPGYIALLLTLVRSAWGGWVLAILFLVVRLRGHLRGRLVVVLAAGLLLSLPLLVMYNPITERVQSRAETLSDLGEDGSFQARTNLYRYASATALTNPVGAGMGSVGKAAKASEGAAESFESGVLAIPYVLGWPGTLFYGLGLILLCTQALKARAESTDQFAMISASIVFAFSGMMLLGNMLIDIKGVMYWSFLALVLAAHAYYEDANDADAEATRYAQPHLQTQPH